MGKFTDAIKGFINKHFTQEVACSHCGKKGKVMFFTSLSDGSRLCSACKNEIPVQFQFKAKESTYEEFKRLYDFMQYTNNQLAPIFNPSDKYSYGDFKVDPVHNLCRIGNSFVFEIKNISFYQFNFQAEQFKEGVFSSKAKGDVYLNGLMLKNPFATFDSTVIKYGAKGKAEKRMFSNTVIYQNPKELDEFLAKFDALWEKFDAEEKERELNDLVEKKAQELLEQREKGDKNNG